MVTELDRHQRTRMTAKAQQIQSTSLSQASKQRGLIRSAQLKQCDARAGNTAVDARVVWPASTVRQVSE